MITAAVVAYPVKVAVLMDKIDKLNCVTLYDLKNKVLRPMGKSFRREDFSDDMELCESKDEESEMRGGHALTSAAG